MGSVIWSEDYSLGVDGLDSDHILALFWRHARGRSLDGLLERATHHHHRVHRVIAAHPVGGRWREYKQWMAVDG